MDQDVIATIRARLDTNPQEAMRGAVATLLFKVMPVDGHTHPMEIERLTRILSDDFALPVPEVEELISHARAQENSSRLLKDLAFVLQETATRAELLTLISHLWEMVFADGRMHETEVLFVERVADLLGLETDDVIRAMRAH